jgi:N-acetylglucosamine-6-phosphate deacetylase
VALGHSRANEAEAEAAFRAGARHVTHLYNAMGPFHHRDAGLLGAALLHDDVSVELIVDGHHLGRKAIDLALRCKPRRRVVLVSDGVAACGMREGEIELFSTPCVVRDGAVRRKQGGQLAGSCLGLDRALRNLRAWFPGLPLQELLQMLSIFPAQVIDAQAECGVVAVGRSADLVLLGPGLDLLAVWCGGRMTWRTSGDDTRGG